MTDRCPHCNADLTGPEITEDIRKHFGNVAHFCRRIGVYDQAADRVSYQCPDCGKGWPPTMAIQELEKKLEDAEYRLKLYELSDKLVQDGKSVAIIRELGYRIADFNESANIAQRRQMELEGLLALQQKIWDRLKAAAIGNIGGCACLSSSADGTLCNGCLAVHAAIWERNL